MITRKQVKDLQPGDVVELTSSEWAPGTAVRGPLAVNEHGALALQLPDGLGDYWLKTATGTPFYGEERSLTVISRAPRPLYVNHPRTEPVPGDVVRDAEVSEVKDTWHFVALDFGSPWGSTTGPRRFRRDQLPDHILLLVDGETGQVVR